MFTQNYIDFTRARMSAPAYNKEVIMKLNTGGNAIARMDTSGYYDLGHALKYGRCGALPSYTKSATSTDIPVQYGVYFGRGTTPPALSDYTLEDVITSGLSITPTGLALSDDENGSYRLHNSFAIQNTIDAPITISEIGLFCPMSRLNGSQFEFTVVLFERTVLDSPITIPAGEQKLVTYQITFNQSQ